MADYKELLRKAVEALPENNGAARRAVYEKARAALVGQLRAINPPLPARDITTHRLQLEDCIRQVEQEASEANIAGLSQEQLSLPPVFADPPKPKAIPRTVTEPKPKAETRPKADVPRAKPNNSIESIIAQAERDRSEPPAPAQPRPPEIKSRPPKSQPVLVAKSEPPPAREPKPEPQQRPAASNKPEGRPLPSIVARAEAAKGRPAAGGFSLAAADTAARRGPTIEPRRDTRGAATARQMEPIPFDVPDDLEAMSAVREVEVEPQQPADPQRAIDRAIATLDREARGDNEMNGYDEPRLDDEPMQPPPRSSIFNGRTDDMPVRRSDRDRDVKPQPRPAKEFATPRRASSSSNSRSAFEGGGVPRARAERGGMGAVTIFLIIFVALLVGAGGAGFWAWQEGFINLDAMFGKGTPVGRNRRRDAARRDAGFDRTGQHRRRHRRRREPSTELKGDRSACNRRHRPAVAPAAADAVAPLALQSPSRRRRQDRGAPRHRHRARPPARPKQAVAAIDPATVAGSQSLLLEASDTGSAPVRHAVLGYGRVEQGSVDETGQPTLVGKANIPARNLSVDVLIRKNSDPSLPASHLMEINFTVSDSFIGGSIAGLPGVLLKNEELVQGAPLVGASARVSSAIRSCSRFQCDAGRQHGQRQPA